MAVIAVSLERKFMVHAWEVASSKKTMAYLNLWWELMGKDFRSEWMSAKGIVSLDLGGGKDLLVIFPCAHSLRVVKPAY